MSNCCSAGRLKTDGKPPAPAVLVAEWTGPPDDMELPGARVQPPPPTPLAPPGISPAALAGAMHSHLSMNAVYQVYRGQQCRVRRL